MADIVLKNGVILSYEWGGGRTTGTAVAVKDGKIEYVGDDNGSAKYIDASTRVIDCDGHTIMPGMCDAHCHPSQAAASIAGVDLFGIYRTEQMTGKQILEEYLQILKRYVDSHPEEKVIRGAGWRFENFAENELPTAADIDSVCSDRPVLLESFCQHNLWVNSKAMELAGIDRNTSDVEGGVIIRNADGVPTGVFREPVGMAMVKSGVPGYEFDVEKYKKAIEIYQRDYANRYGVTLSMDCMCADSAREAYAQLSEEGKLTLNMRGVYMLDPGDPDGSLEHHLQERDRYNRGEDYRIDTLKLFMEGFFYLLEPGFRKEWLEESGMPLDYNGELYFEDEAAIRCMAKAMEAGMDIHVHAMSDGSVQQSVRVIAAAQNLVHPADPRNTIAHLMLVRPEDVDKMAEYHMIGNCQPRWMVFDSDAVGMCEMIGEERAMTCYPYRTFMDHGITIAFGTDFPVTPPPSAMHEIQCAMTRSVFPDAPLYEKFRGKTLGTERPATLEEAIRSITINGAYQIRMEDKTGSIRVGKQADIIVLDRDIEKTDVNEIYSIEVDKTLFKGRVVYER